MTKDDVMEAAKNRKRKSNEDSDSTLEDEENEKRIQRWSTHWKKSAI